MIRKSDIEKIERYTKGATNEEGNKYIYSLFSENEDKREFREYILSEWENYVKEHQDDNYNLSSLLDRIHHKMHIKENRGKRTIVRKIFRWYSAVAAVLLIPLLIATAIWFGNKEQKENLMTENSVKTTLFAPLGSRISFSLPDGTHGWLNSGSSLEYNIPFSYNRQVAILGEAWFDVAHHDAYPFVITVGDSKVKVLGTKFNLNAYPEDNYIGVVLEEGKVEFSVPGLFSGIEMKPDEKLVFENGTVKISTTNALKYSAWVEGKLVFRNDSMTEVARRIERWYNVDVRLVDKELEKYVIRGTFQDDSLEEVLQYLSMTSPIRYRILDRTILDDGTLQKQKVLIYSKN